MNGPGRRRRWMLRPHARTADRAIPPRQQPVPKGDAVLQARTPTMSGVVATRATRICLPGNYTDPMAATDAGITQGQALFDAASAAKELAYCPYSGLRVGAAVLCDDGTIVTAGNVENGSFPLSICAEAAAVAKAISEGRRRITAVAIASDAETISPCGGCRQVILEFADPAIPITFPVDGEQVTKELGDLLPNAFDLEGISR